MILTCDLWGNNLFLIEYVSSRIHFIDSCLLGKQTNFFVKVKITINAKINLTEIVYRYQYQHCLISVRMESKCQYFLSLLSDKK